MAKISSQSKNPAGCCSKTIIVDCSLDELLSEVRGAQESGDDGYTAHEIAEKLGCCVKTVSTRLQTLNRAGRLRCGRAVRRAIDGRRAIIPVYSLKERESTNEAKK